ncbi:hypothetical protein [Nocardioides massiliensis]|uniref:WXG100 family type VII secretion target n=1 Tax=Nocardioides massiliensis TaxID=1325935 RepID=A0ABT9NQ58_9ACTN|nr:hypothetical protein [Nocardioides massiliensis]MDP9822562.1 hypothetical protein [Nocardioides massiliensis]
MGDDLYIDAGMLRRVRTNLGRIETMLSRPANDMKALDGTELGPAKLRSRVTEFADEWAYGIAQLGEFTASAVEALTSIEEAFQQADTDLANALNDANGVS